MANFLHLNTLEAVLEAAGHSPGQAVIWAKIVLEQVRNSTVDNALIGILFRHMPIEAARQAMAEMPPHHAATCYARLVLFGYTDTQIKALMPQKEVTA